MKPASRFAPLLQLIWFYSEEYNQKPAIEFWLIQALQEPFQTSATLWVFITFFYPKDKEMLGFWIIFSPKITAGITTAWNFIQTLCIRSPTGVL